MSRVRVCKKCFVRLSVLYGENSVRDINGNEYCSDGSGKHEATMSHEPAPDRAAGSVENTEER